MTFSQIARTFSIPLSLFLGVASTLSSIVASASPIGLPVCVSFGSSSPSVAGAGTSLLCLRVDSEPGAATLSLFVDGAAVLANASVSLSSEVRALSCKGNIDPDLCVRRFVRTTTIVGEGFSIRLLGDAAGNAPLGIPTAGTLTDSNGAHPFVRR